MTQPFIKKYEPKSLKDIKGQEKAVSALVDFLKSKKKNCAILYGPTGSGKTCAVHALAKDNDLELLEVNASDVRNADSIQAVLGSAAKQMSLFSSGKVILVDEIDGLSGTKDRGGLPELLRIIEETPFPIICTAQDVFDSKFSNLRKKSVMIGFEAPSVEVMYEILKHVCSRENISFDEQTLKQLARQSGGDIRAAVMDLQTLSYAKKILKEDVSELSQRNKLESIPQALVKVFKSTDPKIAATAFENVDEDIDQLMLWIDENLPKEYKNLEDLARAYHYLSVSDVFNRRIRRWQHWRFLVYINSFLSSGIAVSKDEKYKDFVEYKPTMRILKLWMANQKYAKRKAIAEKIHAKLHTSSKEMIKNMQYIQAIFKNNKKMAEMLQQEWELDDEEVEWLAK
jgi:replication factor C large subunit